MKATDKKRILQVATYGLSIVILLFILFPIYWILLLALKTPDLNFTNPPTFFFIPTLQNFIFTFVNPGQNMPNLEASLIEAGGATALALLVAIPAAYSFSRFEWKGRKALQFWYLSLLLVAPIVYLIPFYILFYYLGLVNTFQGLILIYQTFSIPYLVWLYKSFIDEIPKEVDEAALVDGAGYWTTLYEMILPMTAPGLLVTALFVFVFCWNNMIFGLALGGTGTKPLPVGTFEYFTWTGVTWNYIAANAIITMVPPVVIFLVFKKHIVKGLTFGAVKG